MKLSASVALCKRRCFAFIYASSHCATTPDDDELTEAQSSRPTCDQDTVSARDIE